MILTFLNTNKQKIKFSSEFNNHTEFYRVRCLKKKFITKQNNEKNIYYSIKF